MSYSRLGEIRNKEAHAKQKLAELIRLEKELVDAIYAAKEKSKERSAIPANEKAALEQLIRKYKADYVLLYNDITGQRTAAPIVDESQVLSFANVDYFDSPQDGKTISFTKDVFLQRLTKAREDEIEAVISKLNPIKVQNKEIYARFKAYTDRIKKHRTTDGNIDFTHGFWFFAESRAKSREANYYLAMLLQQDMKPCLDEDTKSASEWCSRVTEKRDMYIDKKDNRGINSSDLKDILADAAKEPRW